MVVEGVHSAENAEKGVFRPRSARSARLGALSIGSARPSTMHPSFHHSTAAPPGPWAGRSGWLRPISWSCASWSGSTASQLNLSSTAAHRRSAKGREGRWSHISERRQVFTARLRSSLLAGVVSMLWTCWNESMALGMCRTKFYASGLFLKSYRAHQRRFDICVALKRVAHGRLHRCTQRSAKGISF